MVSDFFLSGHYDLLASDFLDEVDLIALDVSGLPSDEDFLYWCDLMKGCFCG